VNQIGPSAWSERSEALQTTPAAPDACAPPTFVSEDWFGKTLEWKEPDDMGSRITHYSLMYSKFPAMHEARLLERVPVQLGAVVRFSLPQLDAGTNYYVQVRAENGKGPGPWSAASDAMRTRADRPVTCRAPACVFSTATSALIRWAPPKSDSGAALAYYRLRYADNPGMVGCVECTGLRDPKHDDACEYSVTGLQAKRSYYFQVTVANAFGEAEWSDLSAPVAVVQEPPSKPASCLLLKKRAEGIDVAFTKPADMGSITGGFLLGYSLRYSKDPLALTTEPEDPKTVFPVGGVGKIYEKSPVAIDGLQAGEVYFCQVRAHNGVGASEWSDISAPLSTLPKPPDTPDSALFYDHTAFSVHIQWTMPPNNGAAIESFYLRVIPRVDDSEPKEQNLEVEDLTLMKAPEGGIQLRYNVIDLSPGKSYAFQLAAKNEIGMSDWCPVSIDMGTEPTVPDICLAPKIISTDTFKFRIGWAAPHDNGSPIIGYKLALSKKAVFDFACTPHHDVQELTYEAANLQPGTTFFFKVAAYNAVGIGKSSRVSGNEGKCATKAHVPGRPGPPNLLEAGPTWLNVNWSSTSDNGAYLSSYRLRVSLDPQNFDDAIVYEQANLGVRRSRVLHGLSPGNFYYVQVAAFNKIGWGEWSSSSRAMETTTPRPPQNPLPPTLLDRTSNSVTFCWQEPEDNGDPIIKYTLRIASDKNMREKMREVTLEAEKVRELNYEVFGLSPGESCYIVLQCENTVGPTHFSHPPVLGTAAAAPPGVVSGLVAAVEDQSIKWNWEEPIKNGAPITSYKVRHGMNESDLTERFVQAGDTDSGLEYEPEFQLANLLPGKMYTMSVCAINSAGTGPWSVFCSATTMALPPAQMTAPSYVGRDSSSVTVAWTTPEERGSAVTHFELRWQVQEFRTAPPRLDAEAWSEITPLIFEASSLTATLDKLPPSCRAFCNVRARNDVGYGEWSSDCPDTLQTDGQAPSPVDVVTCCEFHSFSLRFEWIIPRCNGAFISKFEIAIDGTGAAEHHEEQELTVLDDQLDGSRVSCLFEGLTPGCHYAVKVRPMNSIGFGDWTVSAEQQTPAAAPETAFTPQCVLTTPSSIVLKWEAPVDNGSAILEYELISSHEKDMSSPISYFTAELGYNVRDLPSGKVVFFRLRCRNEVGWSPWSPAPDALATEDDPEAFVGIITKATAPAEPDMPGFLQRTSRSIKFKWTRPDDHGVCGLRARPRS
jgi:hypothetical protein